MGAKILIMDLQDEGVEAVEHGLEEGGHGITGNSVDDAKGRGENIGSDRREGRGYNRDASVDFLEMLAESEVF